MFILAICLTVTLSLISTELDNCLIFIELDSEISTQLDNCQISTELDKLNTACKKIFRKTSLGDTVDSI